MDTVKCFFLFDSDSEFTAKMVQGQLEKLNVKTLFIELGSLRENGYAESCYGKLRDELLNRELFFTLQEARILIEQWRREYNRNRALSLPANKLVEAKHYGMWLTCVVRWS